MNSNGQKVAILGASDRSHRYSYQAFQMLREHGYQPIPISPRLKDLEGVLVVSSLDQIEEALDTITVYISPEISTQIQEQFLRARPRRVIFNPGSENPALEKELQRQGIHVVEACTLVLLRTRQFESA